MPLSPLRTLRIPSEYALSFDGIDDYVDFGRILYLKNFSVVAWIEIVRGYEPDYDNIIGYGTQAGGANRYGWCFYQGTKTANIHFAWGFGTAATGVADVFVCSGLGWHYVAAVKDGLRMIIYHNGELVSDRTFSYDIDYGSSVLRFGYNGNLPWRGLISGVCIYSRALSQDEILWNYNYPYNPVRNGLVLWLPGTDEAIQPPTWYDKSNFGNNGTIYGALKTQLIRKPVRTLTATRVLASAR